jgi:hypothetical protein
MQLVILVIAITPLVALSACGSNASYDDTPVRPTPVAAYSFPQQEPLSRNQPAAYWRGTDGIEFTPSVDIEVTDLGYYDDGGDGLLNEHTVGIFAMSSRELVGDTVTVDSESALDGGFRYESITPVVLQGGTTYVLAAGTGAPYDLVVADPDEMEWMPEVRLGDVRKDSQPQKEFMFPVREASHFLGAFRSTANFRFRTPAGSSPGVSQ